ncbi:MAG TPA: PP2C family protein-serine/threonine phosphatase [Candidatus Polarisedimenticolia bacterium]|jgi:sigma-B regulation protein RsbU (phosphoserine phosphatase)|nr:PP2C family protein-serine/threonine phosphatase [Candidatus Polarisedimenticolia bacterium]
MTTVERSLQYRSFWRRLDGTLGTIVAQRDVMSTLDAILKTILRDYRDDLNLVAGRLYEKLDEPERYVLRRWYGENPPDRIGYTVPITYQAVALLLERGLLVMKESDPGFDRSIEDPLGVSAFAALTIGEDNRWLLSFSIEGEYDRERLLYLLSAVQHVVAQKIREARFVDVMEEARRIQKALLPNSTPVFHAYELAGRSVAAEVVGGDLFDFIPISDRILAVAVADSSGHGLPAALQARDVITGLRMGVQENLKLISTVEKLNKVINRSTLATRFISLFYGELEKNGNFIYCSAGHPPGLFFRDGAFALLDQGGMVLGPDPDARYERGYVVMRPGNIVVLYSDGITEAADAKDEQFGLDRMKEIVQANQDLPAKALVDLIFQKVEAFSGRTRPVDDQTVVVIRLPRA